MNGQTRIGRAVVDTSALLAIILNEPSREGFLDGLSKCESLMMHEATLAEASIVVLAKTGKDSIQLLDDLIGELGITIVGREAADEIFSHAGVIRHGYKEYGQKWVPGGLNYGDCFSYALAKELDLPLFFQGVDFGKTDIGNAMKALGYEMDNKGCLAKDESVPMPA